ncbi:MAG TPA: MFS transporter [Cytophagaceae bacterium]|nr:MFS transporter [Cytophagaceae bacterium]
MSATAVGERERIDWKFMLPLVLGTMMNPLNSTMLATALATICLHFHENVSESALLITPLYMASAIGQPLMGRLADLYDPKTINKCGFIIILLGAFVGIFAQSFSWLIVSRALFGLGTSAAYPSAMALIAHRYGDSKRAIPGNVLGIITVASQVSMVVGPLLGGVLTEVWGWQGIFLINVPWAILALFLSQNISPVKKNIGGSSFRSTLQMIDAMGILLFAVFLVLLLITLTQPVNVWVYSSLSFVSFILFILWERTQAHPFIDIRLLWHKPSLLLVYIRTMGTNYILFLLLYAIPQWVEAVKEMSPAQTGMIMLPMSLMSALSAILIASKIKKIILLNLIGVITLVMATCCLFLLRHEVAIVWIVITTMVSGIAVGVNIIANQSSLSAEAPPDQTGISFGLQRTFGYLGAIVSGTQLKNIFHDGISDTSLHVCGWYAGASCILLAFLYLIRMKKFTVLKK